MLRRHMRSMDLNKGGERSLAFAVIAVAQVPCEGWTVVRYAAALSLCTPPLQHEKTPLLVASRKGHECNCA
jgi:hypothetical protein